MQRGGDSRERVFHQWATVSSFLILTTFTALLLFTAMCSVSLNTLLPSHLAITGRLDDTLIIEGRGRHVWPVQKVGKSSCSRKNMVQKVETPQGLSG